MGLREMTLLEINERQENHIRDTVKNLGTYEVFVMDIWDQ